MNKDTLLSCFSRERVCVTMREREGEGGGGVKCQRKMSRVRERERRGSEMAEEDVKRERERMIIYSLIRVIQDIRHKYIKH